MMETYRLTEGEKNYRPGVTTIGERQISVPQRAYLSKSGFFSFFVVLEFELRAYTLSHSTSPFFFVMGFSRLGLLSGLFPQDWFQTKILLIAAF
jgi:hypothetical protein